MTPVHNLVTEPTSAQITSHRLLRGEIVNRPVRIYLAWQIAFDKTCSSLNTHLARPRCQAING